MAEEVKNASRTVPRMGKSKVFFSDEKVILTRVQYDPLLFRVIKFTTTGHQPAAISSW